MRHWSQLGIRNWRVKPGRTASALAAIALGVGVVVWVTCAYESVRLALVDQVWFWIGRSHLTVESMYGLYGVIPEKIAEDVRKDPNVAAATPRLKHGMRVLPLSQAGKQIVPASQPGSAPARATLPLAATQPMEYNALVLDKSPPEEDPTLAGRQVVAVGIEPESEETFHSFKEQDIVGRMLTVQDTDAAVLDRDVAAALKLKIGDQFVLRNETTGVAGPVRENEGLLTLVGMIDMHRVAKRQKPLVVVPLQRVQEITGKLAPPGPSVTRVDMVLKDSSPSALLATQGRIQRLMRLKYRDDAVSVTSAAGKLRQVEAAQRQTGFVLMLISTVALFTAFFVILSTLSMGMIERIGQLGMLRCLGMTRLQIGCLVLAEAVPLGLVGIVLGIPVGFGLARLSVWLAPEYIGRFEVSWTGLWMALGGGAATTLLGAAIPMIQALRVSPLNAARSQARQPSTIPVLLAAGLGTVMILYHVYMVRFTPLKEWFQLPHKAVTAAALLYVGYALLAPALVLTVGSVAVRLAALILRVRHRLLSDQVGKAAWRSAAICCGLMVGLSLVVSVVVYSESMASGWDFPKDFCEGFIYLSAPVPYKTADAARHIPGVANSALANTELKCQVTARGGLKLFDFGQTRFVAGTPDEFYHMAKLQFVGGSLDEAIVKLKQGGYVLVTPEFVRTQFGAKAAEQPGGVVGQSVVLTAGNRSVNLKVAGVITSPALNIAADYFNAGEAVNFASAFLVLGTLEDLQKLSNAPPQATAILLNFDLPAPPQAVPAAFAAAEPPPLNDAEAAAQLFLSWRAAMPERASELDAIQAQMKEAQGEGGHLVWGSSPELRLFRDALKGDLAGDWRRLNDAGRRWRTFREELVMHKIVRATGAAEIFAGSVSALKARIDHDLRRATILFTTVPLVALIVAALGVGNLMMANVVSRTRQIAMLRAIGATRDQITRLVIGEALVLGLLGCVLGLTLGLHMADTLSTMTFSIWGYEPKWRIPTDLVSAAITFTLSVCLLAGLIPALRASRSNVIDALQST